MMPQPPISTLFPYTTLFRSICNFRPAKSCTKNSRGKFTTQYKSISRGKCRRGKKAGNHRTKKYYFLVRSEEHTSELQSHSDLVCRLLLEKKKQKHDYIRRPK